LTVSWPCTALASPPSSIRGETTAV
jgi:hypothetical protein